MLHGCLFWLFLASGGLLEACLGLDQLAQDHRFDITKYQSRRRHATTIWEALSILNLSLLRMILIFWAVNAPLRCVTTLTKGPLHNVRDAGRRDRH